MGINDAIESEKGYVKRKLEVRKGAGMGSKMHSSYMLFEYWGLRDEVQRNMGQCQ